VVRTEFPCLIYALSVVDMWSLCGKSVRYKSINQANSAFHPFWVGKWVVIHGLQGWRPLNGRPAGLRVAVWPQGQSPECELLSLLPTGAHRVTSSVHYNINHIYEVCNKKGWKCKKYNHVLNYTKKSSYIQTHRIFHLMRRYKNSSGNPSCPLPPAVFAAPKTISPSSCYFSFVIHALTGTKTGLTVDKVVTGCFTNKPTSGQLSYQTVKSNYQFADLSICGSVCPYCDWELI